MTEALTTLRATGALRAFEQAGVIAAADVHVALRLGKLGGENNEQVLLAAALTVRALRLGSVCVELERMTDLATEVDAAGLPWPNPRQLATALRQSPLVSGGHAGPLRPLVLVDTEGDRLLYLARYHRQEQTIRDVLTERARTRPTVDLEAVAAQLDLLFPAADRQRIAAALAATEWTTIIAGGPGTGKTHTAARILALLYALHGPSLRVALAAPTGKAAARLQEAVTAQGSELGLPYGQAATTLHRLLGWRRDSRSRFAHHAHNRLPHDVVVVDETSMVSLTLMARLAEALRPSTRLVLLGDPDQLASVDAGAVLADLVAHPVIRPAHEGLARLVRTDTAAGDGDDVPLSDAERDRLGSGIVRLSHVHRFSGAIADLADAVRRGAADEVIAVLGAGADGVTFHEPDDLDPVRHDVMTTSLALMDAAERADIPATFEMLSKHRVLCAHREGPHGVRHWTRLAFEWASRAYGGPLDPDNWYAGQPLLVTETDYEAGLSNGDTGAVIRSGDGLAAAFDRGGTPLLVHPSRLATVQTSYAMTIHRSQGSQYDTVTVVLPTEASALLTRQLLYTAITRARKHVRLIGNEAIVRAAVERQALRASGLDRVAP